jgi:hypothetical protein
MIADNKKLTGHIRATPLGAGLSTEGADEWHAWRAENLSPLKFPVDGFDHLNGQEVIDEIDSTPLGSRPSEEKTSSHEYGSTKSPDDAVSTVKRCCSKSCRWRS